MHKWMELSVVSGGAHMRPVLLHLPVTDSTVLHRGDSAIINSHRWPNEWHWAGVAYSGSVSEVGYVH